MQPDCTTRHLPGEPVVWRSIPDQAVSCVCAGILVAQEPDAIALFQPHGAPCKQRTGARGGPRHSLLPAGWDGGHRDRVWAGPANVRVHVVGTTFSVIRNWDPARHAFTGWYINLELPWTSSPVGFDSRDLILDLVVADDLSSCQLKDYDQLRWYCQQGGLTPAQAAWIHQQAHAATLACPAALRRRQTSSIRVIVVWVSKPTRRVGFDTQTTIMASLPRQVERSTSGTYR